jgi:simple sugar transport system substrate-binding protein
VKISRRFLSNFFAFGFVWLSTFAANARIDGKIVVGFSQIGAESAWRVANSKSVRDAAKEAGIVIIFSDAQQKQANQIKAIKSFILQKVDVIVFAPVVTTGWHDVLVEAKNAGIPVIAADRLIDEKDADLCVSFIGSDFKAEGERAAKCLMDEVGKVEPGKIINILELRGTEGSAPALQRKIGFTEMIKHHPEYKIVRSENGDFKESQGKELMEKILKEAQAKHQKIDAVFAHNDNMALGAIAAIEAVGQKPGKDIKIVSVDAIRDAFLAMKDGKLNCSVECSPLLGPQLMEAVKKLMNGEKIPRRIITNESVFPASKAAAALPDRKY